MNQKVNMVSIFMPIVHGGPSRSVLKSLHILERYRAVKFNALPIFINLCVDLGIVIVVSLLVISVVSHSYKFICVLIRYTENQWVLLSFEPSV